MLVDHVTFAYGGKVILRDFTLSLPNTGVTALSGPSGCGKTTLLRLLAGLERPQSGRIIAPGLEKTVFLFQEDRLLPGLSAEKQLRAVLPRGTDAAGPLEAVGLEKEADTPVSELSGGMRRRVALARAMAYAVDKALLILDEPFTGVDPETAKRIMSHLRRTFRIPILLSAHESETLSLADSVIRLQGPPLSVDSSGVA